MPRSADRSWIYCSPRCRRVVKDHNRRTRKLGGVVETISLVAIFDRDGWRCHLCGEDVDRELSGHDPGMASLDHIIPVSDPSYPGHTAANVALAHLRCNMDKGNRVTEADWELHRRLLAAG